MIKVSINFIDSEGFESAITREYEGSLVGRNLNEIESFISNVKIDALQASETALLSLNQ